MARTAGPHRTPGARPRSSAGSRGVGRRAHPPAARATADPPRCCRSRSPWTSSSGACAARTSRSPPGACASTSTTAAWTITTSRSSTRTARRTACRSWPGEDAVLEADVAAGPMKLFCSLFAGHARLAHRQGHGLRPHGSLGALQRLDAALDVDLERRQRLQLLAPSREQRLVARRRRRPAPARRATRAAASARRRARSRAPRSSSAQVRRRRAAASSSASRAACRARRSA